MRHALLIVAALFPLYAHAGLVIHEVAWMGSAVNPNAEWIELFNSGSENVSLSGYTFSGADGSPSVTLEGTVSAGGYYLLERSSDDTVPGVIAGMLFTGALANTGEKLTLYDSSGSVVDVVPGADGWSIGGNNETKETLQRVNGGWGTGSPTPGRANTATIGPPSTSNSGASKKSSPSVGNRPVITGTPREKPTPAAQTPTMFLVDAGPDRTVTVGANVEFELLGFDEDGEAVDNYSAEWSFGDATSGKGRRVVHQYPYPGTYVVIAESVWNRFRESYTANDRALITVAAPMVVVSDATAEYIELSSSEGEEVDLSGWILTAGASSFTIPRGTVVLPGAQIRFGSRVTGLRAVTGEEVSLQYPTGTKVQSPLVSSQETETNLPSDDTPERAVTETPQAEEIVLAADPVEVTPLVATPPEPSILPYTAAAAQSDAAASHPLTYYLMLLIALIGMGVAGVTIIRREQGQLSEASEFAIIDESDDDPYPKTPF